MKMKLGSSKSTTLAVEAINKPALPTKKLQMNIPEDLHKSFKLTCLKQDRDMTDVTVSLISEWLKNNE
ncbi:hypothetical protein EGJ48_23105 [Pantoea dispersa]|uniref:plasmid partition protein ParG n=1 Tax=Pantoea dispersa TaxID=59814 RepID=UPI000F67615C|nr:plasmid partition protein ParG [Pantoea dispersa]RRW59589.1 hypothetical protein EGJ48_23105 [Pantoea dispersa]